MEDWNQMGTEAKKSRYGLNADGSVSICRAKPENVGRYRCTHADHRYMSPREAQAVNEAAAHANALKTGSNRMTLKKTNRNANAASDQYIELVSQISKYSDTIYDDAMTVIRKMEEDYRTPFEDVSDVLPVNGVFDDRPPHLDGIAWRNEITDRELVFLKSNGRISLTGHPLISDESRRIVDELRKYAGRDIDRRTDAGLSMEPTPAEEEALMTLTSNPLAADDPTSDSYVMDKSIMDFGARFVVNSPYMNEEQKGKAFETAPENALESQSLPSDKVNYALTHPDCGAGTKPSRQRIIRNALRHPNVDPDTAYETMKNIMDDGNKDWNDRQKNDFDWQLSMNPNPDVAKRIASLDSGTGKRLTITEMYWNDSEDGAVGDTM